MEVNASPRLVAAIHVEVILSVAKVSVEARTHAEERATKVETALAEWAVMPSTRTAPVRQNLSASFRVTNRTMAMALTAPPAENAVTSSASNIIYQTAATQMAVMIETLAALALNVGWEDAHRWPVRPRHASAKICHAVRHVQEGV